MLQPFHIVIAGDRRHLVRAPNANWRDLQDAFPDYTTSLGPFTLEDAVDAIVDEWPELAELQADIHAFALSEEDDVMTLEPST